MVAIRPQPGPQERFLASSADIAIYGGAAGGGKTWALLMEPLRHIHNPNFGAVIFRRTTPQITNEGALWDESNKLYPALGAKSNATYLSHKFPSGASVSFSHLEHDKTVLGFQGAQIPLMGFDEITHFSASQFWYMVSRNRSTCGVRPYIRATCNPDPDSFVRDLIDWWIDGKTGLPIPERSGVVRWFIRVNDGLIWGDSPSDLASHCDREGRPIPAKSLTFIAASLSDNQALMKADPGYVASLMSLPEVERERLLGGNWKIKNTVARVFNNWTVEPFETPPDAVLRFGADWGFSVDPTVLVRCFIQGRRLYIDHCVTEVGCEIDRTPALFDKIPGSRRWPIRADSARPETISYMRRAGFKIVPAIKGPGSIEDGVEFLRSFDIVVHPRCDDMVRQELEQYAYKTDRLTGEVLPILDDKFNHVIDSLRYSCEAARKAQANTVIEKRYVPLDYQSKKPKQGAASWKTI